MLPRKIGYTLIGIGGFIIRSANTMPHARRKGTSAIVTSSTLPELIPLPEEIAVISVFEGTDLEERSGAGSGLFDDEDIHDQSVLVDPSSAAIGC